MIAFRRRPTKNGYDVPRHILLPIIKLPLWINGTLIHNSNCKSASITNIVEI
jgi:hypothetical protein